MSYSGSILNIRFSQADSGSDKLRPVLALSEPDANGEIECVLVSKSEQGPDSMLIAAGDLSGDKLPFSAFVHPERSFWLSADLISSRLADVNAAFLEKLLRTRVLLATEKHFRVKHSGIGKDFKPGDPVRYAGRVFDEKELCALVDSSLDFWLTAGRYSDAFEAEMARYLNIKNVLLVNSGSSANLVAFSALTSPKLKDRRIKPGDEVITVAAGFPTTVAPIIQNQAVPVFVDVELGSYVPSLAAIEKAIGSSTRAIMIAHTMGVPFPLAEVKELCRKHKLWLIEDNCDALGSRYDGKLTSTFGDISTFSFYPAHHITMGEGGAVVSDDDELADIARSFRDWGRDCNCRGGQNNNCGKRFSQQFGSLPFGYDHKYVYSHIGYNLKATEMQAAIGVAQLDKLETFIEARKSNHARLNAALKKYEKFLILHQAPDKADPSWFGYVITIRPDAPFTREDLVKVLENGRIETRNLFCGNLIRHPAYENINCRVVGTLDNTDLITTNTFFIGVYPGLTEAMIDFIIQKFADFFEAYQ